MVLFAFVSNARSGWEFVEPAELANERFDVCVVGSGMTGSFVVDHFVRNGQKVVLIERGSDVYRPSSPEEQWYEEWDFDAQNPGVCRNRWPGAEDHFDDLARIENSRREWGFFYNMKYGLGGSGAVWSGASFRMMPDDFRTKTRFGYGRDWPVDYDELSGYYDRAEALLEVSGPSDRPGWPWRNNYQYPAFQQSYLDSYVADLTGWNLQPVPFAVRNRSGAGGCVGARNCVHGCPADAVFRPDKRLLQPLRESSNLRIVLGVPCVRVHASDSGAIESIDVLSQGRLLPVRAKLFFLAANAVENVRLLLSSNPGRGLANRSGKLGLGFASHGAVVASVVARDPVYPGRGRPTTSTVLDGLWDEARDERNTHRIEIWNGDFDLRFNPWEALSRLRRRKGLWGAELVAKARESARRFSITYNFELEMSDRNSLKLSAHTDRHGIPLGLVDYRLTERDAKTYEHLRSLIDELAASAVFEKVESFGFGLNGNHPLGVYRAGEDPLESVVDPYLRAHDHPNLYILGGGAFSSTAAVNPTLTIVATTLRALSDGRLGY